MALTRRERAVLNGAAYSLVKAFAAGLILCLGFGRIFWDAVGNLAQVSDVPCAAK